MMVEMMSNILELKEISRKNRLKRKWTMKNDKNNKQNSWMCFEMEERNKEKKKTDKNEE